MNGHRALLKTPASAILAVNGKFLGAALTGFTAWATWPSSAEWWQAAIISVIMGLASVGLFVGALVLIVRIYSREREIARLLSQGRSLRPADLAGTDALRKAGMIDG